MNDDPSINTNEFNGMIVKELKEACRQRGLIVGGKKADLIERLHDFVSKQALTANDLPDEDEFDMNITDEDLAMMDMPCPA